MSRSRFCAAAVAAALAAGLVTWGAAAARAGDTPTPPPTVSPTISPNFGYHPPKVQVRPWQFDLQQSDIGGIHVNDVEGFGRLAFANWTDTQLSPNLDRFSLGGNSLTLWHDALPDPSLDVKDCTITFSQPDGRFRIVASTGVFAGVRSVNGTFNLQGLISLSEVKVKKYGRDYRWDYGRATACPLQFLTPGRVRYLVEYNLPLGAPVTFDDFAVQGEAGVFAVPVRVKPYPVPYPSATETITAG